MGRRVFYPSGPSDVVMGFLMLLLFGGLAALLGYGMVHGSVGGLAYLFVKCIPLAVAGMAMMLQRECVIADGRIRQLEVKRSFFIIPVAYSRHSFSEARSLKWRSRAQGGWELVLTLADGKECILERAAQTNEGRAAELRTFLGLEPSL